jgi:hypothetical protein
MRALAELAPMNTASSASKMERLELSRALRARGLMRADFAQRRVKVITCDVNHEHLSDLRRGDLNRRESREKSESSCLRIQFPDNLSYG